MNNSKQNTRVFEFIEAAFCLVMAFTIFMIFTACSEEIGTVGSLGGAEEETGLKNISLAGRAMRVAEIDKNQNLNEWSSAAENGSIIRMAELDSVTLDTTGVFYYANCMGNSGEFSFDSVSLNSPYVMFELAPNVENEYWYWDGTWSFGDFDNLNERYTIIYSTIVDIRKTRDIDINALTYLESSRLRYLVKQGKSFDEAKRQADSDVLAAFGMYDDAFDFDKSTYVQNENHLFVVNFVNGEFSYWTDHYSSSVLTDVFGRTGSFATADTVKKFMTSDIYWMQDGRYMTDSSRAILYNIVSGLYGLGKCTAEREGDSIVFAGPSETYVNVECKSGQWTLSDGRYKIADVIPSTMGTVVDDRDGTTYNTVTFDIEGVAQTWIVENLRYSNENIHPITHFDTSYIRLFQGVDGDYERYLASLDSTYWNSVSVYEESDVMGDSAKVEGEYFQGICPDGWHIPTQKDWSRLLYLVENGSGSCEKDRCEGMVENGYLGYYASRYLHQIGFGDITYEALAFVSDSAGEWKLGAIEMVNWKPDVMMAWPVYGWDHGYVSIRCLKD